MAQAAHETGEFRWLKEMGSDKYLADYADGDRNYCGRGWLMTTWRPNYGRAERVLACNCLNSPEVLQAYPWAALSAGVYWSDNKLGDLAANDDIKAVTRWINGGLTHLSARKRYLVKAKAIYGILEGQGGQRQSDRRLRQIRTPL
ncbi:MAG: hypothetical protein HC771_10000 [Synechococcales cyanobacterium CRU_2_2]|nr:hypothetical protein [Synechococcales cyanobacterium CRU_2_2]